MKKEEIYKQIRASHKNEEQDVVEKVAADIFYSGDAEEILGDNVVIDKLFKRWKDKKTSDEAQAKVAAESPDHCPICRMPTTAVLLDNGRPAKWCQKHYVVFPCRPIKKDK